MKSVFTAITILIAFSSCSNYYKAIIIRQPVKSDSIENLAMMNKYFILRNGEQAFAIKKLSFTDDQKTLQGNLDTLPFAHTLYQAKKENQKMKYKKDNAGDVENVVLNEVHFYIAPDSTLVTGPFTFPLDKIRRIEVIEKDKQATRKSRTKTGVITGAAVGGAVIAVFVILGVMAFVGLIVAIASI